MNYVKLVLVGLQIITSIIRHLEEKRLLNEGARLEIERELVRAQKIVARAKKIQEQVGNMTDEEIDAALRGDYRD